MSKRLYKWIIIIWCNKSFNEYMYKVLLDFNEGSSGFQRGQRCFNVLSDVLFIFLIKIYVMFIMCLICVICQ